MEKSKAQIPEIYMACGTEDQLLGANQDLVAFLNENDVPVTYAEGSGGHDWDFWDNFIKKAIEWLPLGESSMGINSGNIGI